MRAFHQTRFCTCLGRFTTLILIISSGASADFRFGTPSPVNSTLNSAYAELTPTVSSDGLEVYFWSNRPGGFGSWDLWVSKRASADDEWPSATNVGPGVNSSGVEALPCISSDGLELYFCRGSESTADLMVARRANRGEPWREAESLGSAVNSPFRDDTPSLSGDGLELYFVSNRTGGYGLADIWMTSRTTIGDGWGPPVNLAAINTSTYEQWVAVSSDGLTLLFQSPRSGAPYGGLHMSQRKSRDDYWTAPEYLGLPIDQSEYTLLSGLSPDGTMLYLSDHINYAPLAGGAGSADMWQVPVQPIVDFGADGKVDGADVRAMIDYWETGDLLCDIGPMPWGDGIVNIEDLKVLAGFIGESQLHNDPTLVAHWPLDEAEGTIAYDYAGNNDAAVVGSAGWRPGAGVIGGALEFDGITCLASHCVLNPAEGAFSVLAWIKGGSPGQAIVSQVDGVSWLTTDGTEGFLTTELRGSGRGGCTLCSEKVITDGSWHRVGFTWDGVNRGLYVDGEIVAADTQAGDLQQGTSGLYIGCDESMTLGTFWTGLVDDIRVYDRVVRP